MFNVLNDATETYHFTINHPGQMPQYNKYGNTKLYCLFINGVIPWTSF